jgi:hypothetical protein
LGAKGCLLGRKLELLNLGQDNRVNIANLLNLDLLIRIRRALDTLKDLINLDSVGSNVDNTTVELVIVKGVKVDISLPVGRSRQKIAQPLSLKVGDEVLLPGLIEGDDLESDLAPLRVVQNLDDLRDLIGVQGVERVSGHC